MKYHSFRSKLSTTKGEEVEIQNNSRRGRKRKSGSDHLSLGDLFPTALDVFMAGISFPPQFTQPTDQDFIDGTPGLIKNDCPCCEFSGSRYEIVEHVKSDHSDVYSDKFCEPCLQKIENMEDHRARHVAAEALGQLSPDIVGFNFYLCDPF